MTRRTFRPCWCAAGAFLIVVVMAAGCAKSGTESAAPTSTTKTQLDYAIAIHGGAGTISKDISVERRTAYENALENVLRRGVEMLEAGGDALDTVEAVLRMMEDDPLFNAGKGAVFNHEGGHELDASIMDGETLACGAVAGVTTVKNPISLARLVMERTPHVLLAGPGAEVFADETGVDRVDQEYFFSQRRYDAWRKTLEKKSEAKDAVRGTVGAVALDRDGHVAAATSTGGLTNKRFGRIGDSPVIGAGTYASDAGCAISATGKGEEFIRNAVAFQVSMLVELQGLDVESAARQVLESRLEPESGGVIALTTDGSIAMTFNTQAMPRAAADSTGRFEVLIW
ncbi:MAG: isoaspartyl peptidase/L-asparaginase [Acidobacteriota bacterium]|nr:isoaspartyl peptidase/L-asparaginase [Acidobacteriota bacterium]